MSQVSLPMRIALVVTLAFSAIWLVALRPKPPTADPAAPPTPPAAAQSAPGKAAEQAQGAANASNAAAAQAEQAAGTGTAAPETPAAQPVTPGTQAQTGRAGAAIDVEEVAGKDTSKAAKAVLRDVVDGKVAVLLFWDRRLSDDRAVHRAVKGLSRRGGKVAVHVAPIRTLAGFEPITRGVPVVTSPTVLVIDRAGRARAVGGLSVPRELEELVGKALKVKP